MLLNWLLLKKGLLNVRGVLGFLALLLKMCNTVLCFRKFVVHLRSCAPFPQHGPGRGSFIQGRSVHNQSIERLWRDVFSGCINFFYYLLYSLENVDLLDPDNFEDLWALLFVYLPKIQSQLDLFRDAWCNHPIRTAHN